jgi:pimeloyl-ACP methyl ester carboxylesterase
MSKFRSARVVGVLAAAGAIAVTMTAGASAHPVSSRSSAAKPTVVLVHGAWADGSSWAAVTSQLQHGGYTVDVVPNPLRGLQSDADYLNNYLATISGPIVLVGHSYGGMVITAAATGNANVQALVYVDAFIPDTGDSTSSLAGAEPGSALAADPTTIFNFVGDPTDPKNPDLYVKPNLFSSFFAGGVPARQAHVLAAEQRPIKADAVAESLMGIPAWKTIPSWALIGTADRVIPVAEQRAMAARAGSHVVTVDAPHLSMLTDPNAVTNLIEKAAHSH